MILQLFAHTSITFTTGHIHKLLGTCRLGVQKGAHHATKRLMRLCNRLDAAVGGDDNPESHTRLGYNYRVQLQVHIPNIANKTVNLILVAVYGIQMASIPRESLVSVTGCT